LSPIYNVTAPSTLSAVHSVLVAVTNASTGLNNGVANVTTTPNLGPYTYTYTPSGGTFSGVPQNTHSRNNLAPGNYSVGVKTIHGCTVNKSFTILRTTNSRDFELNLKTE
jgi:hypothetical protein